MRGNLKDHPWLHVFKITTIMNSDWQRSSLWKAGEGASGSRENKSSKPPKANILLKTNKEGKQYST